jgi:predicted aspartyl protease
MNDLSRHKELRFSLNKFLYFYAFIRTHKVKNTLFYFFGLLFFGFNSSDAVSQKVYTKDGVFIGEQQEFIDACVESSQNRFVEFAGQTVGMEAYCYCAVSKIFANITSKELFAANSEEKMVNMMMEEPHFSLLIDCLKEHVTYDENLDLSYLQEDELIYEVALKSCVHEIASNEETKEIWNAKTAKVYCDCALTGLLNKGLKYKDLLQLEDIDGTLFNEVILPCANASLEMEDVEDDFLMNANIVGKDEQCILQLTKSIDETFKVKLNIGGIEKYFLLDTGASMLTFNESLLQELLQAGVLNDYDVIGTHPFQLANNEIIMAELISIPSIQFGCYQVEDAVAAILPNGSLICGVGFLDLFDNWSIDRKQKQLILTK